MSTATDALLTGLVPVAVKAVNEAIQAVKSGDTAKAERAIKRAALAQAAKKAIRK